MAPIAVFISLCAVFATSTGRPQLEKVPPSTLIIGGENATQGEFPYQILFHLGPSQGEQMEYDFCGGALIQVNNTQAVLTTASCLIFRDPKNFLLVAGELNPNEESGTEQRRNVSHFVIFDEFSIYQNDLALVFPDRSFDLNENVAPVPLPPVKFRPENGTVVATGWGETHLYNEEPATIADTLQKVSLPVVSYEYCETIYGWIGIDVYPSTLCTSSVDEDSGNTKDICFGDHGSPLINTEEGYLAGIASAGVKKFLYSFFQSANCQKFLNLKRQIYAILISVHTFRWDAALDLSFLHGTLRYLSILTGSKRKFKAISK